MTIVSWAHGLSPTIDHTMLFWSVGPIFWAGPSISPIRCRFGLLFSLYEIYSLRYSYSGIGHLCFRFSNLIPAPFLFLFLYSAHLRLFPRKRDSWDNFIFRENMVSAANLYSLDWNWEESEALTRVLWKFLWECEFPGSIFRKLGLPNFQIWNWFCVSRKALLRFVELLFEIRIVVGLCAFGLREELRLQLKKLEI